MNNYYEHNISICATLVEYKINPDVKNSKQISQHSQDDIYK